MIECVAPAPAVSAAPAPLDKYVAPAPAVSAAPAPVEEYIAPSPAVFAAPARVEEYISPSSAVSAAPAPVEVYIAPAPAVSAVPAPVEESIAPVPAVYAAPAPGVVSLAPAPVLFASPAPGEHLSPAPAVLRVGGPQGSVRGQSSTSRRRHDLPLPSGWRRAEDASGRVYLWHVHTRQTRWTPPVSEDEVENEEDEEDDEDEYEEDEDMDEIYAESRFPTGFLPMRMCRWFRSGNCQQGWGCMFAHSVSELHPPARGQGP